MVEKITYWRRNGHPRRSRRGCPFFLQWVIFSTIFAEALIRLLREGFVSDDIILWQHSDRHHGIEILFFTLFRGFGILAKNYVIKKSVKQLDAFFRLFHDDKNSPENHPLIVFWLSKCCLAALTKGEMSFVLFLSLFNVWIYWQKTERKTATTLGFRVMTSFSDNIQNRHHGSKTMFFTVFRDVINIFFMTSSTNADSTKIMSQNVCLFPLLT